MLALAPERSDGKRDWDTVLGVTLSGGIPRSFGPAPSESPFRSATGPPPSLSGTAPSGS